MTQTELRDYKSPGHVGWVDGYEYFLDARGDLFVAHWTNVPDVQTKYRSARWEAPAHMAELFLQRVNLKPPASHKKH
jgi:hypothetical protein